MLASKLFVLRLFQLLWLTQSSPALFSLICFVTTTEINALPMSACIAACDAAYGSCVFAAMLTTFGLGTVGCLAAQAACVAICTATLNS